MHVSQHRWAKNLEYMSMSQLWLWGVHITFKKTNIWNSTRYAQSWCPYQGPRNSSPCCKVQNLGLDGENQLDELTLVPKRYPKSKPVNGSSFPRYGSNRFWTIISSHLTIYSPWVHQTTCARDANWIKMPFTTQSGKLQKPKTIFYNIQSTLHQLCICIMCVYIYIYTAYVHTRVFPVYTVDVWYLWKTARCLQAPP